MRKYKLAYILMMTLGLTACSGGDEAGTAAVAANTAADDGKCEFVSTKDDSPFTITVEAGDSEHAKTFLKTCVNPYTMMVINAESEYNDLIESKSSAKGAEMKAIKDKIKMNAYGKAKKLYGLNNCTGCHGGKLEGIMAPSLRKDGGQGAFDTKWVYAKNATDKGMFETISAGTSGEKGSDGAMFVWHKQLEGHTGSGLSTDDILMVMGYIRANYNGDGEKTWMN